MPKPIRKPPARRQPHPVTRPAPNLTTMLPMIGPTNAPIVIVLDPVIGNLNATQPLGRRQFDWLKDHLKAQGKFEREDIVFLSSAPPISAEDFEVNKILTAHMKDNFMEFHRVLALLKPKLIIAAGAKACQQVTGRSVKITQARGQVMENVEPVGGIPVLPIYSPFYAQRHPELENVFAVDIATAGRLHRAGYDINASVNPTYEGYRWCWDLKFLLNPKHKPKRISLDCETRGLRPLDKGNKLLTVQICWEEGKVICIPIDYDAGEIRHHKSEFWHQGKRKKLIKQLKLLCEDPEIEFVGQNLKYDWLWLYQYLGIEIKNYKHDTILLGHLHDENLNSQSIDDLARIHVPEMAGYNDIYNNDPVHQKKSRMDLLEPEKMLRYACGDADVAFRLTKILLDLNEADVNYFNGKECNIMTCYNRVSMPGIRAFMEIEQTGFPIDVDALKAFEIELAAHQKKEKQRLLRMIPPSIRKLFKDTGVGLKPDRAVLLKAYLYTHKDGLQLKPVHFTKTKEPSVSTKQAMPYYAADHPFCAAIIDYVKNQKLLSTYVKGFYKYIRDGWIKPSYALHRTVTGRAASFDPNGQNFPKRGKFVKSYRKIFKAPAGWVLLSNDLSQAELRVAAMMSGDKTMLEVYRNDGDIHTRTAMGVMGVKTLDEWNDLPAEVREQKRFQAKAVNFGFLYGMWWKKFRSYAKTDYGIDFTEEEAQNIREMFFETYPGLSYWHEDVKGFAQQNGYVRSYDGRVRHLPMVFSDDEALAQGALRQAVNSPVQAIASDLGIMAMGRMVEYLKEHKITWIKICGFIHDAIVCLVREERAAEGAALVKHFMEGNPTEEWFGWKPEIPIKADAEVGRTLSKMFGIDDDMYIGKKKNYAELLELVAEKLDTKAEKAKDIESKLRLYNDAEGARADAEKRQAVKITEENLPKPRKRIIRVRQAPAAIKPRPTVRRIHIASKKKTA